MYLGDMVQGVYEHTQFKRLPTKRKPKEEWIVTPNMHEPLVDEDTFELIQKMIDARNRPIKSNVIQIFAGFVKCEDCGLSLGYTNGSGYEYYTCGTYRRYGKNTCSSHYIRKHVLEEVVLDDIRRYSKLAKHETEKLAMQLHQQHGSKDANNIKTLTSELKSMAERSVKLEGIIKYLYEDRVNGKISDDVFVKLMEDYENEQSDIQAKTIKNQRQIESIKTSQKDSSLWINLIREYANIKKLDRDVLTELVDKIVVGESREVDGKKTIDITIHYRFVGAVS